MFFIGDPPYVVAIPEHCNLDILISTCAAVKAGGEVEASL